MGSIELLYHPPTIVMVFSLAGLQFHLPMSLHEMQNPKVKWRGRDSKIFTLSFIYPHPCKAVNWERGKVWVVGLEVYSSTRAVVFHL